MALFGDFIFVMAAPTGPMITVSGFLLDVVSNWGQILAAGRPQGRHPLWATFLYPEGTLVGCFGPTYVLRKFGKIFVVRFPQQIWATPLYPERHFS